MYHVDVLLLRSKYVSTERNSRRRMSRPGFCGGSGYLFPAPAGTGAA